MGEIAWLESSGAVVGLQMYGLIMNVDANAGVPHLLENCCPVLLRSGGRHQHHVKMPGGISAFVLPWQNQRQVSQKQAIAGGDLMPTGEIRVEPAKLADAKHCLYIGQPV